MSTDTNRDPGELLDDLTEAQDKPGLARLFAEVTGLPPGAAASKMITEWKQFGNRMGEARRLNAQLLVVRLDEGPDELADYLRPELDPLKRRLPAIAAIRRKGGKWQLTDFVEASDSRLAERIRRAFPGVRVHEPLYVNLVPGSTPATAEPSWPDPDEATVDRLADQLHMPVDWVQEVLWLLRDRRAVVFYGPPGTGKTYIAQVLAAAVQPSSELRRFVQLHPSYGYEELFEGWRPSEVGDGPRLVKTPGPLRSLVSAMGAEHPGVLLLDEMNRGNIARVFGELFFLLEYRDRSVRLMYSPEEEFFLPEKLLVIGTMNTADRSVAVMDQALRRRFHFVPLFPAQEPLAGLLRRFLGRWRPQMVWVADLLDRANELLPDRHMAIGPSHFLRKDLDDLLVERIWRHSVLPSVEEQLSDQPSRLAALQLAELKKGLTMPAASGPSGPGSTPLGGDGGPS